MITIRKVESRADLSLFIRLPRELYAGMPGYAPPLDMDRRILLDPKKSAFFETGKASYFIAERDGKPVGRISAQIDGLATGPFHENEATFGCLDATNDIEVVNALLRAAQIWARAEGRSVVRGPFTLSINAESGLMIDGFNEAPMVMMPWHPPYLDALVQACGFGRAKVIHSYQFALDGFDYAAVAKKTGIDRIRAKVTTRGINMRKFDEDTEIGRQLFNDAWADNWGFVPMSPADMKELGDNFKMFLFSDCGTIAEYNGEPVGFALTLPNVAEVAADIGPTPGPLGLVKLAYRLFTRKYTTGRIVLFGISKKHRNGALGAMIAAAIIDQMMRNGLKHKAAMIEAGWVLEDNVALNRILEVYGFKRVRSYALYEKVLPAEG